LGRVKNDESIQDFNPSIYFGLICSIYQFDRLKSIAICPDFG